MPKDEKKLGAIKKSVSFPPDIWKFIEETAGPYGEKSKVIQDALRQMKERLESSGKADLKKATDAVKKKGK